MGYVYIFVNIPAVAAAAVPADSTLGSAAGFRNGPAAAARCCSSPEPTCSLLLERLTLELAFSAGGWSDEGVWRWDVSQS